jgi:hypothetical protein
VGWRRVDGHCSSLVRTRDRGPRHARCLCRERVAPRGVRYPGKKYDIGRGQGVPSGWRKFGRDTLAEASRGNRSIPRMRGGQEPRRVSMRDQAEATPKNNRLDTSHSPRHGPAARLVRATCPSTVRREVARTSRAMTIGGSPVEAVIFGRLLSDDQRSRQQPLQGEKVAYRYNRGSVVNPDAEQIALIAGDQKVCRTGRGRR